MYTAVCTNEVHVTNRMCPPNAAGSRWRVAALPRVATLLPPVPDSSPLATTPPSRPYKISHRHRLPSAQSETEEALTQRNPNHTRSSPFSADITPRLAAMMASRAATALRTAALQGYFRRSASTAAAHAERPKAKPMGDYVPVYVALGMIGLAGALGLHTARQQLAHAPNVWVDKRKREAVPEVADPDLALDEAERFVGGSVFRKVAHVQDDRSLTAGVADPVADYPYDHAVPRSYRLVITSCAQSGGLIDVRD
uniref:Uncharacterized protein n=4 Tax=Aegilops tauschii subsp. strangulata TaxID=200361 RepID=A0A453PI72_AEGTS